MTNPGIRSSEFLEALVEVITGGSFANAGTSPYKYRANQQILALMRSAGIGYPKQSTSRELAVRSALDQHVAEAEDDSELIKLVDLVTRTSEYAGAPDKLGSVVARLNEALYASGYQLSPIGDRHEIVRKEVASPQLASIMEVGKRLNHASVLGETKRILAHVESDPSDAITAACSMVESVCKVILDELGEAYPSKKDIEGLTGAVSKKLGLDPGQTDLPREAAGDIRQVLGGLRNVANGIGALRTHVGDAHGKGKGPLKVDASLARFAVNAAATISLFHLETWEQRKRSKA